MTKFHSLARPSAFRKMAAATWRNPRDPSIYGTLDVDASAARDYLAAFRKEHDVKVTISHLVAMAVARVIANNPDVNAKVRFWGKLEQRESVDITLQVATDGGQDLAAARIEDADRKSLSEIAEELSRQAKNIRDGQDEQFGKTRGTLSRLPWWLARPTLMAADLLANELHLEVPSQGLIRDPFGSAMITNVGMFGIDTAFAPFFPGARCPMIILVPEVRERAWAENGEVVSRPVLRLCATFDHRVIDGYHAGKLSAEMRELLIDPERLE